MADIGNHPNSSNDGLLVDFAPTLINTRLERMVIVHRHGHRTPLRLRLPHFEASLSHYICGGSEAGDCVLGQLTSLGKLSMYSLGCWMRKGYPDFIESLQEKNVFVRSSNYERTIGSAAWLLAGLFPGHQAIISAIDVKADNSTFTSTTIEKRIASNYSFVIRDAAQETLYPNAGASSCLRYKELRKAFKRLNHPFLNSRSNHDYLMSKHEFLFDQMDPDRRSIHGLFDALYCRKMHGLGLPKFADNDIIDALGSYSASDWFSVFRTSEQVTRLGIGRVIGEIKGYLQGSKDANSSDKQLFILSGHDSTVGPIAAAFQVQDSLWPPFCSNIIFELLHEEEATTLPQDISSTLKYVRFSYNGKPHVIPQCHGYLHPKDPSLCSLDRFNAICDRIIPIDYESECLPLGGSGVRESGVRGNIRGIGNDIGSDNASSEKISKKTTFKPKEDIQ